LLKLVNILQFRDAKHLIEKKRSASFDIKFSSSENNFCKITPYSV